MVREFHIYNSMSYRWLKLACVYFSVSRYHDGPRKSPLQQQSTNSLTTSARDGILSITRRWGQHEVSHIFGNRSVLAWN